MAAQGPAGRKIRRECAWSSPPASREVFLKAIETGCIQDLVEAGATVTSPGCDRALGSIKACWTGEVYQRI